MEVVHETNGLRRAVFLSFRSHFILAGEVQRAGASQQSLQQLIEARAQGGTAQLVSGILPGDRGAKEISQVFNKRFGLNLRINADVSGNISTVFSKAIVESKSGIPPTFDVIYGPDHRAFEIKEAGGLQNGSITGKRY